MVITKKQQKLLKKVRQNLKAIKAECKYDKNFDDYVKNMEVLDLDGQDYDDLIYILDCHIYPQF